MEELPFGESHWDKLPRELKDMVFDFASPLTLIVNDRIKQSKLDDKTKLDIWLDTFDIDWQGNLSLLPDPPAVGVFKLRNRHFIRVKSRSMYERLCKRFPTFIKNSQYYELMEPCTNKIYDSVLDKVNGSTVIIEDYQLIHVPMHHMWLDLIQDKIKNYPYAIANECIKENHINLLNHLVDMKKIKLNNVRVFYPNNHMRYRSTSYVAFHGNLEILKLLNQAGCHITDNAMDYAAIKGHLDIVMFLHENRSGDCSTDVIDFAARYGHFQVVKWLLENRKEGFTQKAIDSASEKGYHEIVELLNNHRSMLWS